MIPVADYTTVYYVALCVILIAFFLPRLIVKSVDFNSRIALNVFTFTILATTILFIGLRDPLGAFEYFGDTRAYTRTFQEIKFGNRTEFTKDVGFYVYMKLIASFASVQWFYLISAFIYVYLPYLTFKKWFREHAIYVLIAFVVSMSFWAFGINGLRNGLASSLFLFSLRFFDKKWIMYALMLLSITFHKAMLLPFLAFLGSGFFIKSERKALIFWLITIPVSILFRGVLENFAAMIFTSDSIIQDKRAVIYFSKEAESLKYETGFRVDFVVYSAVAIFIGYWAVIKKGLTNPLYRQLYRTYVIANGIWILLIYAPYTNRIAYLSWFLIPIVLTVPFISEIRSQIFKNKLKLIYVLYGSLIFTLFMQFL
jgi:EpsG-like putative glucosyltransferase